jgi:hypothetical protein
MQFSQVQVKSFSNNFQAKEYLLGRVYGISKRKLCNIKICYL